MGDPPRRRRYEPGDSSRRPRGIPWLPLAVIVIFAGFLIGGLAGRLFGGAGGGPSSGLPPGAPHVEPLPSSEGQSANDLDSPTPMPTDTPTAAPSPPGPTPTPMATLKVAASPSIAPSPSTEPSKSATAIAAATPVRKATNAPAAAPSPTAAPVTPVPQHASAPSSATGPNAGGSSGAANAEAVVRSYLGALARGDNATATSYLASGLPSETFMGPSAQIVSVQASPSSQHPGVFKVGADVKAAGGEYYTTFMVQPAVTGGYQIYDHYSIRP